MKAATCSLIWLGCESCCTGLNAPSRLKANDCSPSDHHLVSSYSSTFSSTGAYCLSSDCGRILASGACCSVDVAALGGSWWRAKRQSCLPTRLNCSFTAASGSKRCKSAYLGRCKRASSGHLLCLNGPSPSAASSSTAWSWLFAASWREGTSGRTRATVGL